MIKFLLSVQLFLRRYLLPEWIRELPRLEVTRGGFFSQLVFGGVVCVVVVIVLLSHRPLTGAGILLALFLGTLAGSFTLDLLALPTIVCAGVARKFGAEVRGFRIDAGGFYVVRTRSTHPEACSVANTLTFFAILILISLIPLVGGYVAAIYAVGYVYNGVASMVRTATDDFVTESLNG